jgi:penicillin-binding protein 1C
MPPLRDRSRSLRAALGAAVVAAALGTAWIRLGALPADLLDPPGAPSTVVYDRNGEVLYEARAGDGTRSIRLDATALPQTLVDATIAAEDHRFYWHPGVDPIAIARAAMQNVRRRGFVEGGSTITQQTAKLLLARRDGPARRRGVGAKLREALIALRLEHRFTKREILALYLNAASYGNQLTGAERASRAYFGRGVSVLTPAQAAFLAALPQRPTSFNPYRDPVRARRRQQRVIVEMGVQRLLAPDRVREALDEQLTLVREPAAFVAPHFVARVLADGRRNGQAAQERQDGRDAEARATRLAEVRTTLDADLQRTVQGIVRAERPTLNRIGAHNVAVVVLDNQTAEWLAWEGSGDYGDQRNGGTIDGVTAPRQPGSALKPFTYAAAFEEGFTPATALADVPSFFPTAKEGVLYAPRNYDNRFRGPLLARRALAGSENVPAVAVASRVGVPTLLRLLRAAGLTTFDKNAGYYGLGVTLGDAEVRLDELVAAYSTFARGGTWIAPRMIRAPAGTAAASRIVSERTAFWMTDILSDNVARAYVFGRGGSLEFPFPVAAKTGTSQAYHDNWTIGYTRAVTVGVWVGNFDRRPLTGSSGVAGAGPIFHAVMLAAAARASAAQPPSADAPTTAGPDRTTKHTICALSGMRASRWCPTQIDEWMDADAVDAAAQECTWHVARAGGVGVRWPAEYVAWARTEGVLDRVTPLGSGATARVRSEGAASATLRASATADGIPAAARTAGAGAIALASAAGARRHAAPTTAADPLRVVSPPDGAVYLIDPTLRREFQTLPLRATASDALDVDWRVDGRPVGRGSAGADVDWPLAAGAHLVSARDARGREATAAIVVK